MEFRFGNVSNSKYAKGTPIILYRWNAPDVPFVCFLSNIEYRILESRNAIRLTRIHVKKFCRFISHPYACLRFPYFVTPWLKIQQFRTNDVIKYYLSRLGTWTFELSSIPKSSLAWRSVISSFTPSVASSSLLHETLLNRPGIKTPLPKLLLVLETPGIVSSGTDSFLDFYRLSWFISDS